MIKIKYLPTGHVFLLPEIVASDLKEKSPNDYQILEKNGKAFKDVIDTKIIEEDSILSKVLDKAPVKKPRRKKAL